MAHKSTKKALIFSILSMLLCVTMLMGTTFAWFTDSVSSSANKIVSGNLDVDLLKHNGTEYVSIADVDGAIFDTAETANNSTSTLWEPGKTQVAYLAVRNLGSLALKYNVVVDVTDKGLVGALEYAIVPVKAGDADLTALDWETVKGAYESGKVVAGRTVASNGVLDEIANGTELETDYFALLVHMNEDADNEYKNKSIVIDVKVVATQKDAEPDSFGADYDAGLVPTTSYVTELAAFKAAAAEGGEIVLMGDIALDSQVNLPNSTVLDLNGHTVSGNGSCALNFTGGHSVIKNGKVVGGGSGKNASAIWTEGDVVLDIYDVDAVTGTSGTSTNIPLWTDGTSVTNIYSGNFHNGAGGHAVYSYGSSTVNIYGGNYSTVGDDPWSMINDYDNGRNVVNIYGGTFVAFDPADKLDNKTGDGAGNSASFVADGYKSIKVGDHIYAVVKADVGAISGGRIQNISADRIQIAADFSALGVNTLEVKIVDGNGNVLTTVTPEGYSVPADGNIGAPSDTSQYSWITVCCAIKGDSGSWQHTEWTPDATVEPALLILCVNGEAVASCDILYNDFASWADAVAALG